MTIAAPDVSFPTDSPKSSSWRLVNLALGASSVMSFAGSIGLFPYLVPTRWLMAPWFPPASMASVPIASTLLARIGLNLWLPASLVLLACLMFGLHRRTAARGTRWAAPVLALSWLADIGLTFVPFMVGRGDGSGVQMFIVGVFLVPVYLALSIAGALAAAKELQAMRASIDRSDPASPVGVLAWAIVPPVLLVLPLLVGPGNPRAVLSRQGQVFEASCKDAGVRLMDKPAGPVRSLAYDWDARRSSSLPNVQRIGTDGHGRIVDVGSFVKPGSTEREKRPVFDFTESRPDGRRFGRALVNPDAPYYRFPDARARQPYYGVDALSADALEFVSATDIGASGEPPGQVMRYELTLTDRRSGAVLGVQTFVVDMVNRQACGVNVDAAISPDAFVYDAIHR